MFLSVFLFFFSGSALTPHSLRRRFRCLPRRLIFPWGWCSRSTAFGSSTTWTSRYCADAFVVGLATWPWTDGLLINIDRMNFQVLCYAFTVGCATRPWTDGPPVDHLMWTSRYCAVRLLALPLDPELMGHLLTSGTSRYCVVHLLALPLDPELMGHLSTSGTSRYSSTFVGFATRSWTDGPLVNLRNFQIQQYICWLCH